MGGGDTLLSPIRPAPTVSALGPQGAQAPSSPQRCSTRQQKSAPPQESYTFTHQSRHTERWQKGCISKTGVARVSRGRLAQGGTRTPEYSGTGGGSTSHPPGAPTLVGHPRRPVPPQHTKNQKERPKRGGGPGPKITQPLQGPLANPLGGGSAAPILGRSVHRC